MATDQTRMIGTWLVFQTPCTTPFSSPSSPTGGTSRAPSPRLASGINSAIMKQRNYRTPWPGDPRVNIQSVKGMAKAYQVRQVIRAIEKLERTP